LFDVCLKNDIPLNLTEVAINKFSESLRRFTYGKSKKYFTKIFKILNSEENPASVNAIKIFTKMIKEIDFLNSFSDDKETNEEEEHGILSANHAIEHYLNENELEEKLFSNFKDYTALANRIYAEKSS